MIIKKIKRNNGFTLLELLIYISILAILIVVISGTFISLSKGRGQSNAKSEVNNSIRFATELIRQDVKNASIISTPLNSGDSSSSLVLVKGSDTITYSISDGYLKRTIDTLTEDPVTNNVTNSNVFVDNTKNISAFKKVENNNTFFNSKNISIKVDMIFDYNSSNPDWNYSTSLKTTISLYSNN